ncbi:MAG: sodium:solute symporter [Phycisphaerae bacterium]|nr:sodium:solute symporter [Phycisphaerae bacterium]
MTRLPVIDLAVLVLYLVGTVLAGLWFGRKTRNTEAFMAAGRRLPGWAVGLSIFGTYVSSISFLAYPSKAYEANWNPFVFSLSIPVTAWVAVRFFVPFYRRNGVLSSYEHLEHRFGPWARTYAVVCYLLTQLARMGTIMYLLALTLAPLTGWGVPQLIVLTGGAVIVYSMFGGIEAVIWSDVVQSLVLIVGSLACVAAVLFGLPQGPGQLFRIAAEHDKFGLGSFGPGLGEATFWVVFVYGVAINLQNFGIDQSYVQRYLTARTDRAAARSVWLGAMLYLPISAVFFFIGTGLFAFYTARPDLLPADVAARPDTVFPHFIVTQLPVGLTGLVIAAIFAAAQSTISSSVNCAATLVLCDLYKRYVRPGAGERESMRVLWIASLAVGLLGVAMALAMMRIRSALDAWWQLASIFSGGMLGLFLLGQIARRARNAAAVTGVIVGLAVIFWMSLSPMWKGPLERYRSPFHSFLVIVIGTLTILLVGLLVSRFSRRSPKPGGPAR